MMIRDVRMSDKALRLLSERKGPLRVGFKTLTDTQVEILAKNFTGIVFLPDLENLSDEQAKQLADSKGNVRAKKVQAKIDSFKN